MVESFIANLFLTLRVLLVGGMLLILPRVIRKGLFFGVYVGEEVAKGEAARRLMRSWDLGCAVVMGSALVVGWGISLAGWPLAGNLTGTAVLLLAGLVNYIRVYSRAVSLAPPSVARQARTVTASLASRETRGTGLAKLTLGICLVTAVATFAYAAVGYESMPDRVPSLEGMFGAAGETDKSSGAFMFFPGLNLVVSPFFGLLALLTAGAKRSVRAGSGGRSVEAQDAFRTMYVTLFSVVALLLCAILTLLSVQITRFGLSQTKSLGAGVWWLIGIMIAFSLAGLVWMVTGYGQGGALRERGSAEAPLTGALADNAHWVWGLFYVDRNDPSIMVEKRFGFGYALNYGNRTAILIVVTFLVSILALGAFGVAELMS
jgi:uncharacterized membrane protein